jgi:ATP-dependent DNA helicase DinG
VSDYIDEIFGEDGVLSKHFDGYEPREGQVRMARSVDWSIGRGLNLLAEAPCGIGKSWAYGIPAAVHAIQGKRRAIIVTGNIALQEQLIKKDLPLVREMTQQWALSQGAKTQTKRRPTGGLDPTTGEPAMAMVQEPAGWFTFSLIKGLNNYLCIDKHDRHSLGKEGFSTIHEEHIRKLKEWAKNTKEGDRSELDFEPDYEAWGQFSVSSDECKGSKCDNYRPCYGHKARRAARKADVIVCNYHLLFAHIAVRVQAGKDVILPEFDVVILDEAHKAPDIARDFFGFRLTLRSIQWLCRDLVQIEKTSLRKPLEDAGRNFLTALEGYRRSSNYYVRLRKKDPVPYHDLVNLIDEVHEEYRAFMQSNRGNPINKDLAVTAKSCEKVADQIREAMTLREENTVYFLEEGKNRKMAVLRSKVIDVSQVMRHQLFAQAKTTTMTSATLAVDGGFAHVVRDTGVNEPKTLVTESPFDFSNVLLVTPEMPEPNSRDFGDAVAKAVARVIKEAGGRTLGLFTSFRVLNKAWEEACGTGYRILKHGDAPRIMLLEEFRRDASSVLLGSSSFWAGVDVPGESLSVVVLDRLPFPHKEDPVMDVISDQNPRGWFSEYSLPRAVVELRQGVGRLIRTTSDVGVVVILDRRIQSKGYGRTFLRSLPPMQRSRDLGDVGKWLAKFDKKRAVG